MDKVNNDHLILKKETKKQKSKFHDDASPEPKQHGEAQVEEPLIEAKKVVMV